MRPSRLDLSAGRLLQALVTVFLLIALVPAPAQSRPGVQSSGERSGFTPPSLVNKALLQAAARHEGGVVQQGEPGFVAREARFARRFAVSLTAREALAAMEQGLLTSREYVDILIERIEAFPEINAFISTDFETARAAADEADRMRADGESLGPLHGLPVVIKDAFFTEGFPTTAGTPALADFEPGRNAETVQAMVDAGAIILGKTNLHEIQIGFTTNNAFTGPTLNPHDFERIPGGSSGGNAAALAARFAPLALGEDTGGSARVPAALTGTVGFRPTAGRYSTDGLVPLSSTMDAVGPMARDVRDLALLDAVLTGQADDLEPVALGELRIGVPSVLLREGLAFEVEWHFQRMLRRLDRAGVTLVEAEIPGLGMDSLLVYQAIAFFETAIELTAFLQEYETGLSSVEELVSMLASPSVIALFEIARANPITEEVYLDALENGMPALRQLYLDYLESNDLDAVIYPTVPMPALPIGQEVLEIGGRQVSTFEIFLRNMHYAPLMGAPAVTLPIGQTREQLPAGGMDVMGAPGDDRRTLAVAHAIAQVLPRIRAPRELQPRPYQF